LLEHERDLALASQAADRAVELVLQLAGARFWRF
jgi:hypothetical protein